MCTSNVNMCMWRCGNLLALPFPPSSPLLLLLSVSVCVPYQSPSTSPKRSAAAADEGREKGGRGGGRRSLAGIQREEGEADKSDADLMNDDEAMVITLLSHRPSVPPPPPLPFPFFPIQGGFSERCLLLLFHFLCPLPSLV